MSYIYQIACNATMPLARRLIVPIYHIDQFFGPRMTFSIVVNFLYPENTVNPHLNVILVEIDQKWPKIAELGLKWLSLVDKDPKIGPGVACTLRLISVFEFSPYFPPLLLLT